MVLEDRRQIGKTFQREVMLPVTLLVGLMILAVIGTVIWIAHWQTADVQAREQALAASAIAERLSLLEKTADDYAFWDDSYEHAGRDDSEWVDANVAKPVAQKYGFRLIAVVDEKGRATFGARDDTRFNGPMGQVLTGGFEQLLTQLAPATGKVTTSGVLMLGADPALAAVSRIRPFESKPAADDAVRQRFLVFVDALNPPQLAAISRAYLLPDLHVAAQASADTSLKLDTVDGGKPVLLAWRAADPGGEMLHSLLPILLLLLITFGALTVYVLRQGRDAAVRLRESEERALRDPLTGLPNRVMLHARAEELMAGSSKAGFALAYLDLDGFKQVNDEFGHDMGDEVLKQSTRRIAAAIRDEDLLARLGGDEFAVIFPDLTDFAVLRQITERIIDAVNDPIVAGGAALRVGITIGVALYPFDATSTLELVKAADAALYRAKRNSKGTVQFISGAQSGARN
ncbi:diguanylate cyclase [Ancylobacter sp. 6x-1]|uniref:Diguanylate cyclase n=1 Tax=Ancylobacter crimeensis TaxID=2579147 RepID=A0ABT0D5U8_9HYPH|nr:diguanylate cyclase [Ancylobacter crimeensis]MCK0195307.1 diguanylate cyclase [Ancylobacter crimeensis]